MIFFYEKVGVIRWLAIGLGFIGVLMVISPEEAEFSLLSLLAIFGMLGFAFRDLASRAASPKLNIFTLGCHGFLSLSLTAGLKAGGIAPENMTMAFNYGLDRVRFLTPVNVGSKVRTKAKLLSVDEKEDGRYLVKNEVTMEIEGQEKPAFIAEALTMFVTA